MEVLPSSTPENPAPSFEEIDRHQTEQGRILAVRYSPRPVSSDMMLNEHLARHYMELHGPEHIEVIAHGDDFLVYVPNPDILH